MSRLAGCTEIKLDSGFLPRVSTLSKRLWDRDILHTVELLEECVIITVRDDEYEVAQEIYLEFF